MSRIKEFQKIDKFDLLFFFIPLLSFTMIEYASRGSVTGIVNWAAEAPLQFLISLALFYSAYVFLWANLNHRGVTAVTFSVIWIIIALIIGNKREILGTSLMPWDVTVGSNVALVLKNINFTQLSFLFNWTFLIVLAVNISFIALIFLFQKKKYLHVKTCNVLTILSGIIVAVIIITLPKIGVAESSTAYAKEGYIRGFISSAELWSKMNTPVEDMGNRAEEILDYKFTSKEATTAVKPNVIFIMSEAFWDVTQLPNLTFSEDPIPNFHALSKECISGEMISNTYGGLTDNVEFEVMTGFSLRYLPYQTNAFTTTIKKAIPSLPTYFKSNGYQTVSVHPYDKSFFQRDVIYPLIGIDRFVTAEDMPDAEAKGAYISDDTFADYIISEYQQGQKPIFMYNISIQNHWPYLTENYYKKYDIKVNSNKKIDYDSMIALQNYTQGIHDADTSLKRVVDYFRSVDEPTVIIFLGDHLPALTEDLRVYKQLGYIGDTINDLDLFKGGEGADISERNKMIQGQKILKTPYLIWTNSKSAPMAKKGKTISSSYLGIYTMAELGLELPPFYNFLLDYSEKLPVNRYFLAIDSNGIPFTQVPSVYDKYEKVYESVQNDILFGAQNKKELFRIK